MKNLILGVIAKISKMDAEAKQLAAKVEAQSLLIGALLLTVGKNGGMNEMLENVRKAINAALDAADTPLKSDAELLLNEFNELLMLTQLLETSDSEIDLEALKSMPGETTTD
ncbi:anti-adapter protein IraP [Scandinavium sp. V105_16]|uniref:Anti-adapter protein IraP n=1 Tax=Scandinavium lactucae TaxID=3095028 RepID=A0AAJ2SC75_9ENTR|nr:MULTISPECIES: anti-adapter protein IraP [unclassified Scandinavium]MDX6022597.1 anti-adapter protein IraP [Scandinavium sp. V105_16]MDX6033561.1 anti-adapter protein IraP [Scandinavium sp. V105_12]MDX6042587.1 anti-adapter protein IraP [Scandinavium sp. V105_6]MDX6052588.1 anti-adapter protein IraP [Scandinavium sp. V105_1]